MLKHLRINFSFYFFLILLIGSCGILYGPVFEGQDEENNGNISSDAPAGEIDGLKLWISADSGVSTHTVLGTPGYVCTWTNRTEDGNDPTQGVCDGVTNTAQPSLVSNAINGNPAVRFDDSNSENLPYDGSFLIGVSYTIFSVINITSPKAGVLNPILGANDGNSPRVNLLWGYRTENVFTIDPYSFANNADVGLPSGPELMTGVYKTLDYFIIRKNGSQVLYANSVSDASLLSYNGSAIGRFRDPPPVNIQEFFRGDLAELLIYDRALSESEIIEVESYLMDKYGL